MTKKIISIITICVLIISLCACKKDTSNNATSEIGINVTVSEVKKDTIEKNLEYTGEVKAATSASISSKVSANIISINVNVGDYVEAGTVLLTLDSSQYQQAYNQAYAAYELANASKQQAIASFNNVSEGSIEQSKININQSVTNAQIAYDNAVDNYNRQFALYEIGAISKVSLDSAKTNLDSAKLALDSAKANAEINSNVIIPQTIESSKATIQQAEASLSQAKVALDIATNNLNNCNIVAPISGYIASKNAAIGQLTTPGIEIFSIQNSDMVDVEFNVTESVISSILPDSKAIIAIDSANLNNIEGTVSLIGMVKDNKTGMFPIKISIPNKDNKIKVGMLANISLTTEKATKVLSIDYNALIHKNDEYYVYVADNDIAVKKAVEIGVTDGKKVEIISGLKEGEKVILDGKDFISDKNNKIKIVEN